MIAKKEEGEVAFPVGPEGEGSISLFLDQNRAAQVLSEIGEPDLFIFKVSVQVVAEARWQES